MDEETRKARKRLLDPFEPAAHTFKPQATSKSKERALAVAYVDPRLYQARLDEVDPGWSNTYERWNAQDRLIIICRLTVNGITREATGSEFFKTSNTATSAEAQAFKRACAAHGLGRYLYHLKKNWVDYDPRHKRIKPQEIERLRSIIAQETGQKYNKVSGNQTRQQPSSSGPKRATATKTGGNGNGKVGPTEFWKTASPMIGSVFTDKEAVTAYLAKHDQGQGPDWSAALQGLQKLKAKATAA
jgi:hypothetical protein